MDYYRLDNVCCPIDTLDELFALKNIPPNWQAQIIKLKERSSEVIQNDTLECHNISDEISKLAPCRFNTNVVPKTIICHDMKNGYLEDKYVLQQNVGSCYTFYRWQNIDMFIYFSHHFITVPPLHWINLAHQNGVKILGTIITEWHDGAALCKKILSSTAYMYTVINAIVNISDMHQLDGWLINIENKISNTFMLRMFVDCLTCAMHANNKNSVVLWYDSVDRTGNLEWQNELNYSNCCFFNLCDGIFLNYSWNEENLANTAKYAKDRLQDVYVGIDVFGRNTPYGPGLDCYKGLALARKYNLSLALFAPGWTYESIVPDPIATYFQRFLENDRAFWRTLWPYLYTHPIVDVFTTDFYLGADPEKYNLGGQELQLTHLPHAKASSENDPLKNSDCKCLQFFNKGTSEGRATCIIQKPPSMVDKDVLCHLFATDIKLKGDYVARVHTGIDCFLELVFVLLEGAEIRLINLIMSHAIVKNSETASINEEAKQPVLNNDTPVDEENQRTTSTHTVSESSILSFREEQTLRHIYGRSMHNEVILLGFQLKQLA